MTTQTKFRLRGNQTVITSAGEFFDRAVAIGVAGHLATKMSVSVAVDQLTDGRGEWACIEVIEPKS